SLCSKRKFKLLQQRASLVVAGRGGSNGYVETPYGIDLVVVDFRKDDLFTNTHTIVPSAVERARVQSTEIPNSRYGDVNQSIQKFVHPITPQSDFAAYRHAFSDLEASDRLS